MTRSVKVASDVVSRFGVHLVAAGLLAILIQWLTFEWVSGGNPPGLRIAAMVSAIWLLAGLLIVGMYLLNRENNRLRQCSYDLHDINHIYRTALSRLLDIRVKAEFDDFLLLEQEVLNSVCNHIANIFTNLTGRRCVVTVKLLTEEEGRRFCFTWARSNRELLRESASLEQYAVGTGENTGFDEAIKIRPSGPSYFHAADLRRLGEDYSNKRSDWQQLYRSTIVVPIHNVIRSNNTSEVLGFLTVDTRSPNRLNNTYHVHFMAAFADQMYNFLSLIRRRHLLPTNLDAQTASVKEG